jgi:capsular polysaccharide biosynthesis protein
VNPIIRLNALRSTYAALVSTELIANPVAQRFGIDPSIVVSNVDVGVTTDSLVMYVSARAGGPTEAQALAEEVSAELVEYVQGEQEGAGIGAADRVTLLIVDHARFGGKISPTATDAVSAASLFGAVGMAVGYAGLQFATAGRRIRRARATPAQD